LWLKAGLYYGPLGRVSTREEAGTGCGFNGNQGSSLGVMF